MGNTLGGILGRKLRAARKDAGLTIDTVAKQLGITESALAHIETGRNLISVEHLVKLPAILGVPITDLLPDSVVTDHDKARAIDPRLQKMVELWPDLSEAQRSVLLDTAQELVKLKKRK